MNDESEEIPPNEELYYDDYTLFKARNAMETLDGVDRALANDLIRVMQNAGILFRERAK